MLLAFGGIFGLLLTESGGTEELAKAMLRKFGSKYDTLALNLTGFIISIRCSSVPLISCWRLC